MPAIASWIRSLASDRGTLRQDAVAGVPGAIASVPDGMASAVLVGVKPVYGLYASMAGPIGDGLAVSTRVMVVTTTTAAALAAGSGPSGFSGADRPEALFLLTGVAGVMMVAAGGLRLGRYMRFVSVSVLTGFLTGVAVNIILGQLGDLLGSPRTGSRAFVKAFNVLTHPGQMSLWSAAVGVSALAAGARSRMASIFSGVWLLLILVAFSGAVGKIPIATLAAVLTFAAAGSLRVGRIETFLRTGLASRVAFFATLCATLTLPVAAAVGLGALLSLLLQLNKQAVDLTVIRLELDDERRFVESPVPARLASNEVTVLDVYGSLLFAGARTLETRLPDPTRSEHPVGVLRLRGLTDLSATALIVLAGYAERLASAGRHQFLSGVDGNLHAQLRTAGRADLDGQMTLVAAADTILQSTLSAHDDGEQWLTATRSTVR